MIETPKWPHLLLANRLRSDSVEIISRCLSNFHEEPDNKPFPLHMFLFWDLLSSVRDALS